MSVTDRFPNYLSGSITLSAANTFTTTVETLPIVRPTAGRGRSTIMEFLWVEMDFGGTDLIANGDEVRFGLTTGSAPTATTRISDGSAVVSFRLEKTLTTSGSDFLYSPIRYDLQDKNGFGQLVATDRINVEADSTGQAAAITVRWRIYYRYVTVGAEEYIGIVQSQMAS